MDLHQVRGRLDVARDLIARAAGSVGAAAAPDRRVLDELVRATDALAAATAAVDQALGARKLGPAA